MSIRPVKRLVKSKPTREGAGVHLRRAFGFGNTSDFDPFLLLDDFRNDIPEDYLAGFPCHPHRGIETITYVLAGTVEHGDSMGNRGAIGAGDSAAGIEAASAEQRVILLGAAAPGVFFEMRKLLKIHDAFRHLIIPAKSIAPGTGLLRVGRRRVPHSRKSLLALSP